MVNGEVKVSWRDVLISNGEGRSADEDERFYALATCRSSPAGVPDGGWFFLPTATAVKVAHRVDAHYFGPSRKQIDWSGFGAALALRDLRRIWQNERDGLTVRELLRVADVKDAAALFDELRAAGAYECDGLFYPPEGA